jgi:hypothetical protein
MSSLKSFALAGLLFLIPAGTAHAWLRVHYEDAIVVERSELIVVAHLKAGSIQYVPHERKATEGMSWEHHATLVITQVLTGVCKEKEIPVIIHYGLMPLVGGHVQRSDGFMIDLRGGKANYPNDIIEIIDSGGNKIGRLAIKDARDDNLWFLRKRAGIYGREPGTGSYGIVDPEDLQPLALKDYFLSYRSPNPEESVRKYVAEHPEAAGRAKSYFDHLDVQRLLKVADPKERFDRLLPYFLKHASWNMKSEARDGIIACGDVAGDGLRRVFDDRKYKQFRQYIILTWRDLKYKEVVPLLVELLQKHDQYWAGQNLAKGWWNDDTNLDLSNQRRTIYGEVYYGVCALRSMRDPRARDVIELTLKRWKAINFDNTQIVEECEAALRELSNAGMPRR